MWICPKCGRTFGKSNQHHMCEAIDTVDTYIAGTPEERREALMQVRAVIRAAAPEATECIKWRMPTFVLKENLIHFAFSKNHLGLYPGDECVRAFAERLEEEGYRATKGAIQFPWNRPLPLALIDEITRYRVMMVMGDTGERT